MLHCRDLVVGYHGQALLPPVEVTICRGQLCAVVGRNGSGKTTWFRTMLGLLRPISGEVIHCVEPLTIGYIPQRIELDATVPLRAWDVVAFGLEERFSFLRPWLNREERSRVATALSEVGAEDLARRHFSELSEGQKQRVLIARLVAGHPALAVLDEPTAAMDAVAEKETLEQIDRLRHHHGMTVLLVSHHLSVVSRFVDQVIFFDREAHAVVAAPPSQVFEHEAFRARYGRVSAVEVSDEPA